jgi:hypothetical protein
MDTESRTKFWALIYSTLRGIWGTTEPHIEDAAVREDIPIELYFYSELGLDYFSVGNFQRRDPFTNPEQFEKMFARFEIKDWIFPMQDKSYQVSRNAQEAVRGIVRAGDAQLASFDLMPDTELKRLVDLLRQLTTASLEAPEPPEKWAIINRFRVADERDSLIAQIRESLMDLFAYRDDVYLFAARPHFGRAGIVWDVLGAVTNGSAVNAAQMAERMSLRGYEKSDYEVAIQAAVEIGWVEASGAPNTFRPTAKGQELCEEVERRTNEYFFRPWSVLTDDELDELYVLLTKLHEGLIVSKKRTAGENHL